MSFSGLLPYIQIVLSILLIIGVILQQSDAGLGSAFGGDSLNSAPHSRRGFEKTLFIITIVIAVLFTLSAFLTLLLR